MDAISFCHGSGTNSVGDCESGRPVGVIEKWLLFQFAGAKRSNRQGRVLPRFMNHANYFYLTGGRDFDIFRYEA
jgi:hypothetical protein